MKKFIGFNKRKQHKQKFRLKFQDFEMIRCVCWQIISDGMSLQPTPLSETHTHYVTDGGHTHTRR